MAYAFKIEKKTVKKRIEELDNETISQWIEIDDDLIEPWYFTL